jgi:RHS repeat-associated protein
VSWTYDSTAANAFGRGRVSSMSDPTGSTTYEYDRRGLLRREVKTIAGAAYETRYQHDADGNRAQITYPSGRTATYTFDYAGRPLSAASNGSTLAQNARYLPFGPMTNLTLGNALPVVRTFDARYRITRNELTAVAAYTFGYDNAGNITAITDVTDPSYSRGFSYDDLHRLTGTTSGSSLWQSDSYVYDAMGNLQSATLGAMTRTFAYAGTTPKLTSVTEGSTRTVAYDNAGNETLVDAQSYTYGPRNTLSSAPAQSYEYDGRGVRVVTLEPLIAAGFAPQTMISSGAEPSAPAKVTARPSILGRLRQWWSKRRKPATPPLSLSVYAQMATAFTSSDRRRYSFYTPELQLMSETGYSTAAAPPIAYDYVWFNGEPLAQVETATGTIHYYFNDHLGAPILQTDASGAVVWRVERDPYGERFATRVGSERHQPLGLPGQEHDASSDRQYNIFRWYRAGWGRYTQVDPRGLGQTERHAISLLYGYGENNPGLFRDPLGLYVISPNCNSSFCGPMDLAGCSNAPRTGQCIDQLFKAMRDHVTRNQACRRAIEENGVHVGDFMNHSTRGYRGYGGESLILECNAQACDPSSGGVRNPHYDPGFRRIQVCSSLFQGTDFTDASQSLMHEVLHHVGVNDRSAAQDNILRTCYPTRNVGGD